MPRSIATAAATVVLALAAACAPAPRAASVAPSAGDAPATTLDLAARLANGGLRPVGRTATAVADGGRTIVRLDSLEGSGVAWLEDVRLADGTIDVELRGRNVPAASFVGVAFHGVTDSTYEAVYVRPFNFHHADSAARAHAVQYVSEPAHPWHRLRREHPGAYETGLDPAPDPDAWLRLRVVVAGPTVAVHVNGAARPALVVRRLAAQGDGRVGLWVGSPSPGDFATLRVTPASR